MLRVTVVNAEEKITSHVAVCEVQSIINAAA